MKLWMVMGVLAVAVVAQAQEPAAAMKTTLSAGVTLTDGNSETLQVNGSLVTEGEKPGLGSVRAGVEANYGEDTVGDVEETTVNNAKAFANAKKSLCPRTFAYGDTVALQDDVADVTYRLTVGPGLGGYLVKNDRTALSVEAGPSYLWEEVADVRDDYWAIRFAERLDQMVGKGGKVWQSAEYLPKADDFDDYLLNTEVGAEAPMTERLGLRLVLQDKYDSTPAPEQEKNDVSLVSGLTLKW